MTKKANTTKEQSSGLKVLPSKSDEWYCDEDWWKENILRWNKAQDIMGIKQTLWVLRYEMGYDGWLHEMDPMQWDVLFKKLTSRYHKLVKWGKIDAVV
tara:strand:- start:228 stop:521 length:294 start_codon:yes stop_codon:yes gene_type:complete